MEPELHPVSQKAAETSRVPGGKSSVVPIRTPKPGGAVNFPDWPAVLAAANMPDPMRSSYAATLRWFMSFCRRNGVRVDFNSARQFIKWAVEQKNAGPHLSEQWRETLRWFFRTAHARQREREQVR